MIKIILVNGLMNLAFGAAFFFLNNWALQNNFEETFILLALFYGFVVIVGNALYIFMFCKK